MSLTVSSPLEIAQTASVASRRLATLSVDARNDALVAIHEALDRERANILAANAQDVAAAHAAAAQGSVSQSVLKRLDLARPGKYDEMLTGILDVRKLDDPYDGLELERVTCPIGVLLIIFEARPEVIANIASLAIKSGNAAILKGGKETSESFKAIAAVISAALDQTIVPNAAIQLVMPRDVIASLLKLDELIDLCIPRGSNELVRFVKDNTKIPVLGHADGLCNIYLHCDADPDMAVRILLDAKLGYSAACNAVETLLVHEGLVSSTLLIVAAALIEREVVLRCDDLSYDALQKALGSRNIQRANATDFKTEFLAPILAVRTITSKSEEHMEVAVDHINTHSSHHTDAIITGDAAVASAFQRAVESACVFWNTSPRMSDGMRFGFGTEVGISTSKIHARGPVGLEGITIYKYLINGNGHIASEYGDGKRSFKHQPL